MAANRLAMNPAKIDILWCSTSHQPSDSPPLTLAGVTVLPSSEVRNLGVVFDSDLIVTKGSCQSADSPLLLCLLVYTIKQFVALHHVISTNCASQFPLFPTFLLSVSLFVVIWSYPEQGYNQATGHFVWLVRSPEIHCHYNRQNNGLHRNYI